jgi:hypothetical protein
MNTAALQAERSSAAEGAHIVRLPDVIHSRAAGAVLESPAGSPTQASDARAMDN